MPHRRGELHELLKETLGSDHVYFQPPESVKLEYPCLVYVRDNVKTSFADNTAYHNDTGYLLTIIDRDPDSEIPHRVQMLPKCLFVRFYIADNLNHDVYRIFF